VTDSAAQNAGGATGGRNGGREAAIIDAFVHLSDTLVADYDVIEFLHFLTERCVALGDVDEAAVMLASPSGRLQAVASSSERTRLLELFELQNQDGPCFDAYQRGEVVVSADLTQERTRWPTFTPEALDVGFRAVLSIPLRLRQEIIGALNLLRLEAGEVSHADALLLQALTDIATVGVLQERLISQSLSTASGLQAALTSRIRIEQAKGVLAERLDVSVDEAFAMLRAFSRNNGLRLTEVATAVVERSLDISDRPPPPQPRN